jgi:[acyl-carrier-protein] S-malonyltransferase
VRWAACVETLIRAGCTTFLEIGPGRVLSGLVRQINREVDVSAVDSPGKIEAFATAHRTFVRH